MKVPYLKERRRAEMINMATEFSDAITQHLALPSLTARLHSGWLNSLYPLLALLQIFLAKKSTPNPSREFALEGARISGDGAIFLEAMNSFGASVGVNQAMQHAYAETIFSGFMEELRSDLLMAFVNGLMYSYRNSAICLRCSLEDLYRHLYYMDHPQEYRALREEREGEYAMKLSPLAFREYIKRTSYLKDFSKVNIFFGKKTIETDSDYFSVNENLYGSLSAAVHGASEDWFAAVQDAGSLKKNQEKEDKLTELSGKMVKMCIAFLIAAHRDIFASAGEYDKSIVLDAFSSIERKNFRQLLNI